jgi:hypothetical protein
MVDYLDVGGVPENRRVLGALGPWARDPMPWFRQLARALI